MKKVQLLASVAIGIGLASCSDSEFDGFTRAESGMHYKFHTHSEDAKKVEEGDGVTIRYIISNQKNDSVIVDSKNVSSDGTGYVQFGVTKSSFKGSFEDGLMMMAKGDSAEFIISADSFFLKTNQNNELPKGFNPGDRLKGVFMVKDIRTKKELEENQKKQMAEREAKMKVAQENEKPALEKYLADNNVKVKPTASGLYYIEVKKGSGPSPKPTDMIKVNYSGRLLDGTEFDSSERQGRPAEMELNRFIPGWVEAFQMMKKGGKAKLIVPSSLAYGPQGGGPIPPFATLVFDVELIDFMPAPPQAQEAPPAGH